MVLQCNLRFKLSKAVLVPYLCVFYLKIKPRVYLVQYLFPECGTERCAQPSYQRSLILFYHGKATQVALLSLGI